MGDESKQRGDSQASPAVLGYLCATGVSEIFPTNIRSHTISIAILTMWAADTLVGQFTPALREGLGPSGTFILFACFLVPQIFAMWKMMRETAGRSLEEIERTCYGEV